MGSDVEHIAMGVNGGRRYQQLQKDTMQKRMWLQVHEQILKGMGRIIL